MNTLSHPDCKLKPVWCVLLMLTLFLFDISPHPHAYTSYANTVFTLPFSISIHFSAIDFESFPILRQPRKHLCFCDSSDITSQRSNDAVNHVDWVNEDWVVFSQTKIFYVKAHYTVKTKSESTFSSISVTLFNKELLNWQWCQTILYEIRR
jgi:hypothetical protein